MKIHENFSADRFQIWITEATEVKRRPSPEDLIPLISGGVDPRMDKLKQWTVNLDYWNLAEQLKPGETAPNARHAGRYGRLLDVFFQGRRRDYGRLKGRARGGSTPRRMK